MEDLKWYAVYCGGRTLGHNGKEEICIVLQLDKAPNEDTASKKVSKRVRKSLLFDGYMYNFEIDAHIATEKDFQKWKRKEVVTWIDANGNKSFDESLPKSNWVCKDWGFEDDD